MVAEGDGENQKGRVTVEQEKTFWGVRLYWLA